MFLKMVKVIICLQTDCYVQWASNYHNSKRPFVILFHSNEPFSSLFERGHIEIEFRNYHMKCKSDALVSLLEFKTIICDCKPTFTSL